MNKEQFKQIMISLIGLCFIALGVTIIWIAIYVWRHIL